MLRHGAQHGQRGSRTQGWFEIEDGKAAAVVSVIGQRWESFRVLPPSIAVRGMVTVIDHHRAERTRHAAVLHPLHGEESHAQRSDDVSSQDERSTSSDVRLLASFQIENGVLASCCPY